MGSFGGRAAPVATVMSALALAGCAGSASIGGFGAGQPQPTVAQPQPVPMIPATIRASEVIGRWGYASYHDPKDRARTEANARGQCTHPYVIGQGPNGGVMMYPADQSQLTELYLKGSAGGKNYIGPSGQPGGSMQDEEILVIRRAGDAPALRRSRSRWPLWNRCLRALRAQGGRGTPRQAIALLTALRPRAALLLRSSMA